MRGQKMGQLCFSHLHQLCWAGERGEGRGHINIYLYGSVPSSVHLIIKPKWDTISWSWRLQKAMNTGFWYQNFFFIPIPASPYFCFIFISPHSIFLSLLKYPLSSESFNAILIQPYIKNTSEYFKILKKITMKLE